MSVRVCGAGVLGAEEGWGKRLGMCTENGDSSRPRRI